MTRQIDCIISGRVQGVLFRDFSRRTARRLGLVGTVENLPDGTVKLTAQGDELKLQEYIKHLKHGNMFSRVLGVEVRWSEPTITFSDFQIKYGNFSDWF
jgi:acylphosphatase